MIKKIFPIVLLTLFSVITSCSSSDYNNITSKKGYAEVTLLGDTHRREFEEGLTFSYGAINCDAKLN
ncbi:hypothetical protein [Flavobacterium psychrolimnae]|uniref:Uncharacterized protein n=1 Tax=Flavobacterium psychrolimnae TaxID=249351 RepID=A0A366AZ84_9FLAO|nr:hypothetical protein [Flavobacterium psychrolimnae]RBN50179.1 hypothetical protein DR980_08620 [Flavobacterium psychrolimnae]